MSFAQHHLGRITADQRAERRQDRGVFVDLNKHNTTNSITQITCGRCLIFVSKDDIDIKGSVNQTEPLICSHAIWRPSLLRRCRERKTKTSCSLYAVQQLPRFSWPQTLVCFISVTPSSFRRHVRANKQNKSCHGLRVGSSCVHGGWVVGGTAHGRLHPWRKPPVRKWC
jgi:hypothetical protein